MREEGIEQRQEVGNVLIVGCRCHCGHEWKPWKTTRRTLMCPRCGSTKWDDPDGEAKMRRRVRRKRAGR